MTKLLNLQTKAFTDEMAPVDLELAHDTDIMTSKPDLAGVSVIAVNFPAFKDGRAFTQVRVLRERYGFEGEIRVTGHVIPDQALHLLRQGASTIAIDDEARADDFIEGLSTYRYAYQRPAGGEQQFVIRGDAA